MAVLSSCCCGCLYRGFRFVPVLLKSHVLVVSTGDMDPHGAVSGSASIHSQRSQLLYQRFLSDAAAGLTFSPDTESGTDRVSYSQADFRHLFRPTGVLRPVAKRPVERRHYRASPRLKHQLAPGSRLLPLLPESPESVDHSDPQRTGLLQDSCRRTRGTEVQPVHKGAHKTQIIFKDSNYTRNLQRRSHPDLKNRTTHTPKSESTNTFVSGVIRWKQVHLVLTVYEQQQMCVSVCE